MPGRKWYSTVTTYEFNSDDQFTTGVVGEGEVIDGKMLTPHSKTCYGSMWHRIPDTTQLSTAEFANNYPEFTNSGYADFVRNYLQYHSYNPENDGFMFLSALCEEDSAQVLNAWFEIGPIDMSSAESKVFFGN